MELYNDFHAAYGDKMTLSDSFSELRRHCFLFLSFHSGVPPDYSTYYLLLTYCDRFRKFPDAERIYNDMRRVHAQPDPGAYNIMIRYDFECIVLVLVFSYHLDVSR